MVWSAVSSAILVMASMWLGIGINDLWSLIRGRLSLSSWQICYKLLGALICVQLIIIGITLDDGVIADTSVSFLTISVIFYGLAFYRSSFSLDGDRG